MSELRRVENRLTLPLDAKELVIFEGLNPTIHQSLSNLGKTDERVTVQFELAQEIDRDRRVGEAVYVLVKRQELASLVALATFSNQTGPVEDIDRRLMYTPIRIGRGSDLALEDEVSFLNAVHRDVRDGLKPGSLRYEGEIWTAASFQDLIGRKIYEDAHYEEDHSADGRTYYTRKI